MLWMAVAQGILICMIIHKHLFTSCHTWNGIYTLILEQYFAKQLQRANMYLPLSLLKLCRADRLQARSQRTQFTRLHAIPKQFHGSQSIIDLTEREGRQTNYSQHTPIPSSCLRGEAGELLKVYQIPFTALGGAAHICYTQIPALPPVDSKPRDLSTKLVQ